MSDLCKRLRDNPIRFDTFAVSPTSEQRQACMASGLYQQGDCIAVWLNEGDSFRINADREEAATTIESLQARIAELEAQAAVAWRPIETAPKDGTPIIIARDMGDSWGWVRGWAHWEEVKANQWTKGFGGWVARGFFQPVPGELGLAEPTHWQPVPAIDRLLQEPRRDE